MIPLIACELRVALRRRSTFWLRIGGNAGAIALAMWMLVVLSGWGSANLTGRAYFRILAAAGFLVALLLGLLATADSLSQEKREGTLGLLFLTDLTPQAVVSGKLWAKLILPFYALLSLFPVLMISVVVAGTTGGEFVRIFLVWTNALFFSLAASLMTSSLCWQQRAAHVSAAAFLLFLTVGAPWAGFLCAQRTGVAWCDSLFASFGPFGPLIHSFGYDLVSGWFWTGLCINQALAWIFLSIAVVRVTAFRDQGPWKRRGGEQRGPALLSTWKRHSVARQLLEERPIEWLELHKFGHQFWLWTVPLLVSCVFVLAPVDPGKVRGGRNGFILLAICQTALKLWIAAHAAYAFAADRRSGALESLLGTKVGTEEITAGMFRSFVNRFKGPIAVLAGLCAVLALVLIRQGALTSALLVFLTAVVMLWDAYCVFWVGLYQGLVSRTPAMAAVGASVRILALPWAWFGAASIVVHRSTGIELMILWLILTGANHSAFLLVVKGSFERHFRVLALKPFGEKTPRLENKWSPINWDAEEEAAR